MYLEKIFKAGISVGFVSSKTKKRAICFLIVLLSSVTPTKQVFPKHFNFSAYKKSKEVNRRKRIQTTKNRLQKEGKQNSQNIKKKYNSGKKAGLIGLEYINRIYKSKAPTPGEGREKRFRKFLKRNAKLFGIEKNISELGLIREKKLLGSSCINYGIIHDGIEVFGANIFVSIDRGDQIRMLKNKVPGKISFIKARENIQRKEAYDIAAAFIKELVSPHEIIWQKALTKEVFYPVSSSEYKKALVVFLKGKRPYGMWKIIVDKENGDILYSNDMIKRLTGSGKVFDPNPVVTLQDTTLKDNNDSDSAALTSALKSVSIPFLNNAVFGLYTLSGSFVNMVNQTAIETSPSFSYTRSDNRFNEVMTYYHINNFHSYLVDLGFSDLLTFPLAVDSNASPDDNSFYFPAMKKMEFGQGGVDDAEDADVIVHEYGHAIMDDIVPGYGTTTESNSIGEAFGDYIACTYSADKGFNPTIFADWDSVSFSSSQPPFLRKVETTLIYPDDSVGETHNDAPLFSAPLWELRGVLGKEITDTLVIYALQYVQDNATFQEYVDALVSADLALNQGSNRSVILDKFREQGIYKTILNEEFEGSNFPPSGWSTKTTSTGETWVVGGGLGDKYPIVNSGTSETQDEWIYSPVMYLASDPKLSFFWIRLDEPGKQGTAAMKVRVSTDGGSTFGEPIFTVAQNSVPEGDWVHKNMDLSSYANEFNVVIGFQYIGSKGDNIAIDNIIVVNSGFYDSVNLPPSVHAGTPSFSTINGIVSIPFTLGDMAGDELSLSVEYSTDGGTTFFDASIQENTTGFTSSTSGVEHSVSWRYVDDLGKISQDVIVRLTVNDGEFSGRSVNTASFFVDASNIIPSQTPIGMVLLVLLTGVMFFRKQAKTKISA